MPLTDVVCKSARCPADRGYKRFSDALGLYLEVTKTGTKCWRWKYRFAGKEKRLALGVYPGVSLGEARTARDDARRLLAAGTDPAEARRGEKEAAKARADTAFEAVARAWWEHWRTAVSPTYADSVLRRLEIDAFPEIGLRPVGELVAQDFVRLARKIERRGAGELARRVWKTCGLVMRYAVMEEIAARNPVADVLPRDALKRRDVVNHARVGADELPELMRQIFAYGGSTVTRLALQLMALTFVRTTELLGARWEEFDLEHGEWEIPAERMKKRRPHEVPLSRQAVAVLTQLRDALGGQAHARGQALLFPGERDREKPMSNNTILFALYRMGYRGLMTGHGFRGVATTALMEMGYSEELVRTELSHGKDDKVWAAYNHARYIEQRREMMQVWADYLDAVRLGGKVIPFRRGRTKATA